MAGPRSPEAGGAEERSGEKASTAQQCIEMANILYCVEQTLNASMEAGDRKGKERAGAERLETFKFPDFLVQIRGRILKDPMFAELFYQAEASREKYMDDNGNRHLSERRSATGQRFKNKLKNASRSGGRNDKTGAIGVDSSERGSDSVTMEQKYEYLA